MNDPVGRADGASGDDSYVTEACWRTLSLSSVAHHGDSEIAVGALPCAQTRRGAHLILGPRPARPCRSRTLSVGRCAVATVTQSVVFTDLVASTALMSRLGEVRADEVRRRYFGLLRSAVADTGGREVKNLGDGLMVVFDGVGAALACAVAMQQAVTAHSNDDEPLSTRIGVAAGEVDTEEGDYFGVPVVEAARLCAIADSGEIVVTDMVRLLARSRGAFDLEPAGDLLLKGLADPVTAHRVRWSPLEHPGAGQQHVQRVVVALGSGTVVGRDAERSVLETAMNAVRAGERRAVFVGGEPGIGKTTLATSFALDETASGAVVLFGRCHEDLWLPYQPWAEALGHLVAGASDQLLAAHVEACGPVLARLLPEFQHRLDPGSRAVGDTDDRHLVPASIADLLGRAASDAPVVLILDDLHWADNATLQLLRQVLVSHIVERLLVIGTYRDSEIDADHPLADLLARMHREQGIDRVLVRGFGDHELLSLLETIAGHEMDNAGIALRDALLAETDGNPFFVGEMLRHLRETGSIRQNDTGRWVTTTDVAASGLPVSIREVIGRRVRFLGTDARRVLVAASVIGRSFRLDVLEATVDIDIDHLIEFCDTAVHAAILRPARPDEYTFAHALIERSLYDELSPARRARAHLAVAEALETVTGGEPGERAAELAYHWSNASRSVDTPRAVRYARLAGDHALFKLAPAEAARWYQKALTLDPDLHHTREGIELRIALAEAQRRSGHPTARADTIATSCDAADLGYPDLLVAAALAMSTSVATSVGEIDNEIISILEEALDTLSSDDSPARARIMARLANELVNHPDAERRLDLAHGAVDMARRLSDDDAFADVVLFTSFARSVPGQAPHVLVDLERALITAEAAHDTTDQGLLLDAMCWAAIELADRPSFDRHLGILGNIAASLDEFQEPTHLHWSLREIEVALDGDPLGLANAANAHLTLTAGTAWEPAAAALWSAKMVTAAHQRGDLAPLLPAIDATIRDNPGLPIYRSVMAWALATECQFDAAAELVATERATTGFDLLFNNAWLNAQALWAFAAHATDDADSAELLLPRLEPHTHLMATNRATVECSIAFYAGLARSTTGDLDTAVAHLEHAGDLHRRVRSPFFTAMSDRALSSVLALRHRPGDIDRARALAHDALTVAAARGYGYVERDARRLLYSLT